MEYVIKANSLNISYGRDEPIITDASMLIKAQEFVFITGKSGSGKSTIIKSLYGELFPNRGDLTVCGVDFKNINSSKLFHHISNQGFAIGITTCIAFVCFGFHAHSTYFFN